MKLGKLPARHDPRTLRLKHYSSSEIPPPPAFWRGAAVVEWPMYANDQYQCCTCAAAAHMVHDWTAIRSTAQLLSDAEVLGSYLLLTGGDVDRGVAMLDALRHWRSHGIGAHQIHSYVALDAHSAEDLRIAISLFGSAYIGLELPNFAMAEGDRRKIPWVVPPGGTTGDAAPNADNGHCVAAIGYDEQNVYVVTWGALKTLSWEFFEAYNEEAYGVLSTDWVDETKEHERFNFKTLERDLALLSRD